MPVLLLLFLTLACLPDTWPEPPAWITGPLASAAFSWACFHPAERAFWNDSVDAEGPPRQFFSRRAFVWFHLRQNLALVFLPVILLAASKEARRLFPALMKSWELQVSIAGAVLVLVVFLTMPWIIRLVLGLESLPEGPMRQRLMATATRLNFRFSDILLWNTRGGIANAMVVGIIPQIRYVLLTGRLL